MNYQKIIKDSEIYLRQGQISLASKIFLNIQLSKVPLNDVVSVARLGRRTGHISASLKFLQKHISKKTKPSKQRARFYSRICHSFNSSRLRE